MKKIALLFATVLLSVCAHAAMPVEGTWGMQHSDNGFLFDTALTVGATQVTITNQCTYSGRTAQAQVSVPASVTGTSLRFLASANDSQSLPGISCDVSIEAGELNYVIQGNLLILTQTGNPQQLVLVRR